MTTKIAQCMVKDRALWGEPSRGLSEGAARHASLTGLVRQPWAVRVGRASVVIRGATPRDLAAVAAMHSRCSPQSLLNRYRAGGRRPAVAALEMQLREPLSFLAAQYDGTVVATATWLASTAATAGMPRRSGYSSRTPGRGRAWDGN